MKLLLPPAPPKDHDKKNQDAMRSLVKAKLDELLRQVMKLEGR